MTDLYPEVARASISVVPALRFHITAASTQRLPSRRANLTMVEDAKRIVVVQSSLSMCGLVECSRVVARKYREIHFLFISEAHHQARLHRYFHPGHLQLSIVTVSLSSQVTSPRCRDRYARIPSRVTLMAVCHKVKDPRSDRR